MLFFTGEGWIGRFAARAENFSHLRNVANGPKQMELGLPSPIGLIGSSKAKASAHTFQLVLRNILLSLASGRDGPTFSLVNKAMMFRHCTESQCLDAWRGSDL